MIRRRRGGYYPGKTWSVCSIRRRMDFNGRSWTWCNHDMAYVNDLVIVFPSIEVAEAALAKIKQGEDSAKYDYKLEGTRLPVMPMLATLGLK